MKDEIKIISAEQFRSESEKLELFGAGEWIGEPDRVEMEYQGVRCRIFRDSLGVLLGFALVEKDHPFYEKDYEDIDIDIHGGLTSAGRDGAGDFWIIFDCGHVRDFVPLVYKIAPSFMRRVTEGDPTTYKNIEFVKHELKKLVCQIKKAAKIDKD